jgi:sulfonate transport system substrate-binding protein
VKIIAVHSRERPIYSLATAPDVALAGIADLRGKRIGYSPGQAQGALVLRVLRKAGLTHGDVQLVELESPAFRDALASRQIDVAPLTGTVLLRYLAEYGADGASAVAHGVRDNLGFFYVRAAALADANRAAALRAYVDLRTRASRWTEAHPDAWIDAYYVRDQGLTAEQGRQLLGTLGWPQPEHDWSEAIALTQETIDLLAEASGRAPFDARTLFDRRFEGIGAEAAEVTPAASPSAARALAAENHR